MRYLLSLTLLCLSGTVLLAQTSLGGKVTEVESGEPIIFANVALYKNGTLTTGAQTDFDGNYNFANIDPGTYDVEVSNVGYQPKRVEGVVVFAGKSNKLDVELSEGVVLEEVEVVDYKVPLIEQDNTTSGQTITSEQIKNLPTRNINALAATTAGLASSDEGSAITIRGSRSSSTDYYVDGIRVQGNLIPESEIDQLQVITGGIEAQYGDVTGGIISITTKGPSSKWSGGIELESSQYLDPYNNSLAGFNISGPLAKNKDGQSIIGIRLAGRYTYRLDDDPPATEIYQIRDESLAELENQPIVERSTESGNVSTLVAADYLRLEDGKVLDYNPNEEFNRVDVTAKLDARLSDAIDITFTGAYSDGTNKFTPGSTGQGSEWRFMNSHNNPENEFRTYRGNFRFRHRLGGPTSNSDRERASVIQNASYNLQFSYENEYSETGDIRHGENLFDYGYVGNFDIEWIPSFAAEFDPNTGTLFLRHTDYRQLLRGYTPGDRNPVLANYNKVLDLEEGEGLNANVPNYIITTDDDAEAGDINRTDFIAPNGTISDQFTSSWNFFANVGTVYNSYGYGDNDTYTFTANSSFDLVPGGSDRGRHSIQFGIWYEQRTNRGWGVNPRGLWDIARQQANIHILGIPESPDTIGIIDIPGFEDTPLFDVAIDEGADNLFFKRIREVTGQSLKEYVNVDGLSPDDLSLDMFSAKELTDQNVIDYTGYDHLGNEFDGTFDEFFTTTDADGIRTFPVAPNRPIYAAAYVQDKFTFKDIIFRIGLRVDRYDANTQVLKDNYSLYEIQGASDFHANNPDLERPGNIGDDYKVYTNEAASSVTAYRDGDQWFFANGAPANSPTEIFAGGLVFPAYADERVNSINNFIKNREFDPNVSFEDYEPQINWMPRLAFSFPISDQANFFAHYDVLVQRPSSNTLATALDYFYFVNRSNIRNNPNLQPERTITYEVGFQQRLSNTSALKIASYYREMRDMIQVRTFFPVPIVNQYTTYDNLDFGTVKGFTFQYDLRRTGNVSLQANYTLQFADGTGSNADSQRGLTSRGNIRTLIPLNFDERHRFNLVLDYRYGSGTRYTGPRLFGKDILSDFGVNLQAIAVSGRPYTARAIPTRLGGAGFKGAINGARLPWNFTVNLRVDKNFSLANNMGLNVYVRISNLLDRQNVLGVYSFTGSPEDDGYLASSFGQNDIQTIQNSVRQVESFLASYQWAIVNPNLYSLPRRIFLGAIFNF